MTEVSSAIGITSDEILEELFPGSRVRISVTQGGEVLWEGTDLPSGAVVIVAEELAR